MVTESELENGIKGTIEEHIHYNPPSIAVGTDASGNPIAYIYNIPSTVDGDDSYLAVQCSKLGGKNPQVAHPSSIEYVIGFEISKDSDKTAKEICTDIINKLGYQTIIHSSELDENAVMKGQPKAKWEEIDAEVVDEEEQDNTESHIDLSNAFD